MEILYGTTRMVILWRQWAFKIPYILIYKNFLLGLVANLNEFEYYRCFKSSNKICPILYKFPFGICNIMIRTKSLNREEFYSLDYDEWIKIDNLYSIPVENKIDSFGKIDDKIVAVDYH